MVSAIGGQDLSMSHPEPEQLAPRQKRWLLFFLGSALALALGYLWLTSIVITDVPPGKVASDPERYFGFCDPSDVYPGLTVKDVKPRNIFQAKGRFLASGPYLRAILYRVDNGEIEKVNSLSLGESPNRLGTFFGESLAMTIALGDMETPDGRVTTLGSMGHTRGYGTGGPHTNNARGINAKTFPGSLSRGSPYLVYYEGEKPANAWRTMSVEEFAKENKDQGSYLVVTAKME
jgi:hypothetical protein